jgi:anti-anti-sigma factor
MKMMIEYLTAQMAVIQLSGRFDAFHAPTIRAQIDSLISTGTLKIVVDLSETSFLDSAGLAVLVNLLKQLRQLGGDAKLVWPKKEEATRILRLTKFDRVFEISDTVELALSSF